MLSSFLVSLRLAAITAPLAVIVAMPVAALLGLRRFAGRLLLEVLCLLPLVLPPTVLGFYLLIVFRVTGGGLAFSFGGLVCAGVVVTFPLVVQNLKNGIEMVPRSTLDASVLLGKSAAVTFLRVLLPQIKRNVLAAFALAFAKTIGEFGVMMMVGGNIPGRTRLASLALYERVEVLDYRTAHVYAAVLVVVNSVILAAVTVTSGHERIRRRGKHA